MTFFCCMRSLYPSKRESEPKPYEAVARFVACLPKAERFGESASGGAREVSYGRRRRARRAGRPAVERLRRTGPGAGRRPDRVPQVLLPEVHLVRRGDVALEPAPRATRRPARRERREREVAWRRSLRLDLPAKHARRRRTRVQRRRRAQPWRRERAVAVARAQRRRRERAEAVARAKRRRAHHGLRAPRPRPLCRGADFAGAGRGGAAANLGCCVEASLALGYLH